MDETQFSIIHALKGNVHLTDMKYLIKLWSVLLLCIYLSYVHTYLPIQYFYDDPQYSRSSLVGLRDFIKVENKVFLYSTRNPASRASKRARLVAMYIAVPN